MKKRLTGLFIILLILTAFSSVTVAQDTTTLLWGMWGSPEEIAVHQQVADAYMKANPNVKVELWSQPWGDYFTKMDTLFAAGVLHVACSGICVQESDPRSHPLH
jgi:ABC-type glycerol-3-phosphate transport system substrate-binding protein